MSKINNPILASNAEKARSRIVEILTDELSNQLLLQPTETALIGHEVNEERSTPYNTDELDSGPKINVRFVEFENRTRMNECHTNDNTFFVDMYCKSKSQQGKNGDSFSAKKSQRIGFIVYSILSSNHYLTLGGIEGAQIRAVRRMGVTSQEDNMDTENMTMSRLELEVRLTERTEVIMPRELLDYQLKFKPEDDIEITVETSKTV